MFSVLFITLRLRTAAETRGLREELLEESQSSERLKRLAGEESSGSQNTTTPLFLELLEPWFHNPASALALCLWSQQYVLASELTGRFAAFEPTLDFLQQLDQLVLLIESPIFSRLRLRLLEPKRHPELLTLGGRKCLLGLAMLLPQAGAFQALRERMHLVQSSLLLEAREESSPPSRGDWWASESKRDPELAGLMEKFDQISGFVFVRPGYCVLAAIVISSVAPLVAYTEAIKLWRVKKNDFFLWVAAFLGTLFLGVLTGIALAVGLSLAIVIYESVRPQITILWRLPGTTIYRNVKQESSGAFVPNVFIARIGSSIYFANAFFIKEGRWFRDLFVFRKQ
eukprot:g3500.t1